MHTVDQLGNRLTFSEFPKKIISLVPSISELLWDLNLQNEITGVTKFCIHPNEMFTTVARVGGTKKLNIEASIMRVSGNKIALNSLSSAQ